MKISLCKFICVKPPTMQPIPNKQNQVLSSFVKTLHLSLHHNSEVDNITTFISILFIADSCVMNSAGCVHQSQCFHREILHRHNDHDNSLYSPDHLHYERPPLRTRGPTSSLMGTPINPELPGSDLLCLRYGTELCVPAHR